MSSVFVWLRRAAVLALTSWPLVTGAAQADRFLLDPVDTHSVRFTSNAGSEGACFSTIDRGPITPLPFGDPRLTPGRTLAGFFNFFRPGAPPVPCNRFHVIAWAGMSTFALPSPQAIFANRRLTLAILKITEVIALPASGVINKVPPCESGGGCLRSTQSKCNFRVGILNQDTAPGSAPQELVTVGRFSLGGIDLQSRPRPFSVTGVGGTVGPSNFDVTREFRAWANGGAAPRFMILPSDSGIRTTDFATDCRVLFRMQLDVSVGD